MFAGLLVSVALGRILGAEGLGVINLANRIGSILLIIALLGVPQLLIKEIAIAYQKKDWQRIRDCLSSAFKLNGGIAILISVAGICLTPWLANNIFHEPDLTIPLIITLAALIFQVFSRMYSSGLIGFRKIWQSNLVNESLSIAIVGLVLLIMWLFNVEITIIRAAFAYGIGRVIVAITMNIYWKSITKSLPKQAPENIAKNLAKASWPFLLVSATGIISTNIDGVMLGWLGNVKDVGLYSVAARISTLTIFFLQVTNSAISPKLAALFAERKIDEMNKMVQSVTMGLMVVTIFPLIFFIFGGSFLLSLWGKEFTTAYWALIILSIGQCFNIATGPTGLVLIMCGYEKLQSNIMLLCLAINVILDYILIPPLGYVGAALGSSLALILLNLIKIYFSKKKVGISTLPNLFKKN